MTAPYVAMALGAAFRVRFDDTLTTIFAQPSTSEAARIALWQHVVDQLAQDKPHRPFAEVQRAWQLAQELRAQIPLAVRRRLAMALGPMCRSVDIVLLFSTDLPSIAAPIITQAQLSSDAWLRILPRLPVPARALLRERRDLPPPVWKALQAYGPQDFVLEDLDAGARRSELITAPPLETFPAPSQNNMPGDPDADDGPASDRLEEGQGNAWTTVVRSFRFATDMNGRIVGVRDAPSAALIGIDISRMAETGSSGADGLAAAAFRSRSAFRDAHLLLPGRGGLAGDWLITCMPRFSEGGGQFLGYLGSAKRAPRALRLRGAPDGLADVQPLPDGLRHFLHEVRTPLNAVRGFSDVIAAQLYGPVSHIYRRRAEAISAQARQLADILDEVQLFGRLGEEDFVPEGQARLALTPLIGEVMAEIHAATGQVQSPLSFRAEASLPGFVGDPELVRKMIRRLFQAMLSAATPQERLETRLVARGRDILLIIARPKALADLEDAQLFESSHIRGDMGYDLPLGFGFAIRLVRALAHILCVRLELTRRSLTLRFPAIELAPRP